MPWTLLRFMVFDLLRVLLLTTLVLVTVIAFGAAIKPLANDRIVTAGQTLKYVMLVTVPMLQFALPFAAGFAGTITMHRMTTDNEIVAAAASGISYRRLLAPIFGLGLALVLLMVVLTQWVIPRFWGLLAETVARDVVRMFEASIERGEPFEIGDQQIYADRMIVDRNPESGADTRLVLVRVAAVSLDDDGRLSTDVTAGQAVIDVYRRDGVTYLKMAMEDTVVYRPDTGMLSYVRSTEPPTVLVPSVLEDDPKHMTRGELLELRENPDRYGSVIEARTELADALLEAELLLALDAALRRDGTATLRATGPNRRAFEIRANQMRDRRVTATEGGVEVVERLDGAERRTFRPRRARVVPRMDATARGIALDLVLEQCEVVDAEDPAIVNQREEIPLLNLVYEPLAEADYAELSSGDLLARAVALGDDATPAVHAGVAKVELKIGRVQREVRSRLAERYAVAATAMLLLVLGAVLAMWLRHSVPLTIYLWAFLPSIIDLIAISSGEHLMRDGFILSGGTLMWAGHAILAALILAAYARLSRN